MDRADPNVDQQEEEEEENEDDQGRIASGPTRSQSQNARHAESESNPDDSDSDSDSVGGDRDDDEDFVYVPGDSQPSQHPSGPGKVDAFGIKRKMKSFQSVSPAHSARQRAKTRTSETISASVSPSKSVASSSRRKSTTRPPTSRSSAAFIVPTAKPSDDQPLRVFAPWDKDGNFYLGKVISKSNKGQYTVLFDDGERSDVPLSRMFSFIRPGDRVKVLQCPEMGTSLGRVTEVIGPDEHGLHHVTVQGEKKKKIEVTATSNNISISKSSARFEKDRVISLGDIPSYVTKAIHSPLHTRSKNALFGSSISVKVEKVAPPTMVPDRRRVVARDSSVIAPHAPSVGTIAGVPNVSFGVPSSSAAARLPGQVANSLFAGYLFIMTNIDEPAKSNLVSRLRRSGARVVDLWTDILTFGEGFGEVRWHGNIRSAGLHQILLLSDEPAQTPKYLMALALGVPCVSIQWVHDRFNLVSIRTLLCHLGSESQSTDSGRR
jgi:hypothetical protein